MAGITAVQKSFRRKNRRIDKQRKLFKIRK